MYFTWFHSSSSLNAGIVVHISYLFFVVVICLLDFVSWWSLFVATFCLFYVFVICKADMFIVFSYHFMKKSIIVPNKLRNNEICLLKWQHLFAFKNQLSFYHVSQVPVQFVRSASCVSPTHSLMPSLQWWLTDMSVTHFL